MLKNLVYSTILSVTTIGATIRGNAIIPGNQIDKLALRMDKVENGLGDVQKEMAKITSQQESLKAMASAWVADCSKKLKK